MSNEAGRVTVFLSYAHADRAKAQRLAAALQKCDFVVWWDALIEGGTRFTRSIEEALQKADVIVVLWSRESIAPTGFGTRRRKAATANAWCRCRSTGLTAARFSPDPDDRSVSVARAR